MKTNYHTHCRYCDGKGEPREYVEYAISRGFSALGFSGHCPLPYPNKYSIKKEQYTEYCDTIRSLKDEYHDRIDIRLGLEIDYIPGMQEDFSPLINEGGLEYSIGSVHLVTPPGHEEALREGADNVLDHLWYIDGGKTEPYDEGLQRFFGGDIRLAVKTFFYQNNAMIERNTPTVIGHIDKVAMNNKGRFFSNDESWYRDLLYETLHLLAEKGCICEINTRGIYKGRHDDYYPSRQAIRYMDTLGIPVIVSTDAHLPEDIDKFEGAYEFLHDIGYHNIVTSLD